MIDINLIRTNKELVKENIKKKFQDEKLPLVDKVEELDKKNRALKQECDSLRAMRNTLSGQIGQLMREKKLEDASKINIKKSHKVNLPKPLFARLDDEFIFFIYAILWIRSAFKSASRLNKEG